eukprot:CAMPEP_0196580458 /NCGR_PEP_ID=MMETSP1081-20130531/28642_1 /TAXON_ID=36882 /ORGANISM="Pyramimonas amylifera, Strain CCMP720" /LENGTH=176 /DNA_ID=CAMNT_0041900323 /DNA_START=144 /DNA_END=674 /DNA_ORIENTATION=-
MTQPWRQEVFRVVVLNQTLDLKVQQHGDIIAFYNSKFMPALKSFLCTVSEEGSIENQACEDTSGSGTIANIPDHSIPMDLPVTSPQVTRPRIPNMDIFSPTNASRFSQVQQSQRLVSPSRMQIVTTAPGVALNYRSGHSPCISPSPTGVTNSQGLEVGHHDEEKKNRKVQIAGRLC